VILSVRVDEGTAEWLDGHAATLGTTRSEVARRILAAAVTRRPPAREGSRRDKSAPPLDVDRLREEASAALALASGRSPGEASAELALASAEPAGEPTPDHRSHHHVPDAEGRPHRHRRKVVAKRLGNRPEHAHCEECGAHLPPSEPCPGVPA
jgi:hypothetical protein